MTPLRTRRMSQTRGISTSFDGLLLMILMCMARGLETASVYAPREDALTRFDNGVSDTTTVVMDRTLSPSQSTQVMMTESTDSSTHAELCYVCHGSYTSSPCGNSFKQDDPSVSLEKCNVPQILSYSTIG